jgi:hypothetical protein
MAKIFVFLLMKALIEKAEGSIAIPYTQIFSQIKIAAKSANWVSRINFHAQIFLHVWFEFYRQRRSRDYRRR